MIEENEPILHECEHCSEPLTIDKLKSVKEHDSNHLYLLCPDCQEEHTTKCDNCGDQYYTGNNDLLDVGDQKWCQSCRDDHAFMCGRCEDTYHIDDSATVNVESRNGNYREELWCQGCTDIHAYICDDCGYLYTSTMTITNHRGREIEICYPCRDSGEYTYCESCDTDHHMDHDCGCATREEDEEGLLSHDEQDYTLPSTKSCPSLPLMGFELEIEKSNSDLSINDAKSLFLSSDHHDSSSHNYSERGEEPLFKHDGSLSNGFEFVTQPKNIKDLKNYLHASNFADYLNHLSSEGYKSHQTSTCGLHVHMERKHLLRQFTGSDGDKATAYNNSPLSWLSKFMFANDQFLRVLARREANQWAKARNSFAIHSKGFTSEKYLSLRLSACNNKTIEFRLFKGTLKPETILATIELCHALYQYALTHPKTYSWWSFQQYALSHPLTTANLKDYIAKKLPKLKECKRWKKKCLHTPKKFAINAQRKKLQPKVTDYLLDATCEMSA